MTASYRTTPTTTSCSTKSNTRRSSSSSATSASIERQLREQILLGVDKILLKEKPSRSALYSLLKLCNPSLTPDVLDNAVAREKAFRNIKARLHPDKFDAARAPKMTQVFQNVQTFYVQCCHALADEVVGRYKKRSSYSSTTSSSSSRSTTATPSFHRTDSPKSVIPDDTNEPPLEMDVFIKFPQLRQMPRCQPFQAVGTSELYYHLGYSCLNLRGAVCHGQAIDCTYQVPVNLVETQHTPTSIQAVWQEAGFTKVNRLTTVSEIKLDILKNGPVVSTSFTLDPYYFKSNSGRHAGNFSERHVGLPHPLLLVGWKMTSAGEVWIVQALRGPAFTIGVGQFNVDKLCLAPPITDGLERKTWQSPGPYWDVGCLGAKCQPWRDHFDTSAGASSQQQLGMFDILPLSSEDIEKLADLWDGGIGFNTMITERRAFVVRDTIKQAQSRRVILREVSRVTLGGRKVWKVTLSAVRK